MDRIEATRYAVAVALIPLLLSAVAYAFLDHEERDHQQAAITMGHSNRCSHFRLRSSTLRCFDTVSPLPASNAARASPPSFPPRGS
jgi:hypothetical protein